MTSYLRGWFSLDTAAAANNPPSTSVNVPEILEVSPPDDDDDDDDGESTAGEDDKPPVFPALGSAQRASSSNGIPLVLTDSQLMPPPPLPNLANRKPGTSFLGVTSSESSSLAVPLTTTKKPTLSPKKRAKVALAPGHSPLDWASLKSSGADLRVNFFRILLFVWADYGIEGS
jgi:hypothetical protein